MRVIRPGVRCLVYHEKTLFSRCMNNYRQSNINASVYNNAEPIDCKHGLEVINNCQHYQKRTQSMLFCDQSLPPKRVL